ncbi:hypothetical protein, partial [Modicisalibacter zincidurans]|uniref:hypothetical protein n=1 Tax=Modicisalibacter zincidurans TaxID=1178777 RepID=UPI0031EF5A31
GVAGEGTATGAKRDVGHGTVWVNDDIRYIAMQVSRLEALQGGQSHGFRFCFGKRVGNFEHCMGYVSIRSQQNHNRF